MSFRTKDFYSNYFIRPPIKHRGGDIKGDLYIDGDLSIKDDLKANNFYASGNYYLENYILIPAGSIIQSASINEPEGWLDCDGRILNKEEYPKLFEAIGYTFSYGNFSNDDLSFNLPDFRGRVGVGIGSGSGLTNRELADISGSETHTLNTNEIPSHNHSGTTEISGSHTHIINDPGHTHSISNQVQKTANNTPDGLDSTSNEIDNINLINNDTTSSTTGISINNGGNHNHTFTTENTGGGQPHNIMQPFLSIRYLIKY